MSFDTIIKNKRIVIVGPAASMVGSKQGSHIDAYDLVVRINKAIPVPSNLYQDIGSRTDILYNCLHPNPESGGKININLLKKVRLQYLCCPYPPVTPFKKDIHRFVNENKNRIPFRHIDTEYYIKVVKAMGCRPNSGIAAILDLLKHDIKELYITGFTFFQGGYYKEYKLHSEQQVLTNMKRVGVHDQRKQKTYIKSILLRDARVKMDKTLTHIIKKV